ncbi:MAG: ATP-binding protein [Bdellovibrionota bacterium]
MVQRFIEDFFYNQIKKNKSILLLGPRQTGKTTLIKTLKAHLYINFSLTQERRRFEKNPDLIINEIEALSGKNLIVIIDEIQKVPAILDPIQSLIDEKKASFILTGSSARKLRRQSDINLLPGRVVSLRMDPFMNSEFNQDIDTHLIYGSLPGIAILQDLKQKNIELRSYVDTYLEEEVRSEALVRNLPAFYRFLEMAALESGKIISFNAISQSIGVAHTTVSSYYQILEDCLLVERVDPIYESASRKKLTKSSKYLFFDSGVRRMAADEGPKLGATRKGELFESFVGLELIRESRLKLSTRIHFWRDPDGPEIDWVIKSEGKYTPIEVKISEHPSKKDIKHLKTFMQEYPCSQGAYVICTAPRRFKIEKDITAIPWQEISKLMESFK